MILFISQDGPQPSGVTTYGYSVLRHLPESRLLLLNADEQPSLLEGGLVDRTWCLAASKSHSVVQVSRAIARVSGMRSTCVMPNNGDTPWSATLEWLRSLTAERRNDTRVLGIVHSDTETQYALAERYLPIAPVWIGVSRQCTEELKSRVGSRGAHIYELSCAVPAPGTVSERVHREGPLRLAYVGRLEEPQKRVSRLVETFAQLSASHVDFVATIAGDGPARRDFCRQLASLGECIARRVAVVGGVEPAAVNAIWREHDVCLLTSAYEGMPLALLEAMAAGVCPVVMAVESGLPELVQDGKNGRVVPQGDVIALAHVIAELSRDRAQVARLGQAARETILGRFSPDAHFRRLRQIIDELWAMPPPNPEAVIPDPTEVSALWMAQELQSIGKPVAVFGAGMFGRKVVDASNAAGLDLRMLVDSDPSRHGSVYAGLACQSPTALCTLGDVAVAIGSIQFADEMQERIAAIFHAVGRPTPSMVAVPQAARGAKS